MSRCGSGLSGQILQDSGHFWVGIDISPSMLEVASERRDESDCGTGDVALGDVGQGFPFRSGCFDGAVSISALQWLCNADKRSHHPAQRLLKLFSTLYSCLTRGSRAVFQFYPENSCQIELIMQQATRAGFSGGLVIDFPNSTKAKKIYLVLFTGGAPSTLPPALQDESQVSSGRHVSYSSYVYKDARARGKPAKKSKEWILQKKERRRRQGKTVRPDTKYTGRKRSGRFSL